MRASLRRIASLTRMEITLLVRNKTTLFNAIALAPLTVALMSLFLPTDQLDGRDLAAMLVGQLIIIALAFVIYYNLTTTAVARREELMLKRLSTGPSSRFEILTAMAMPAVLILAVQVIAGYLALGAFLEFPQISNPLWLLIGLIGGSVVFAAAAFASTAFTRSVEAAQLTTLPFLMVVLIFSGALFPLSSLGETGARIAGFAPLAPVFTLAEAGMGIGDFAGGPWQGLGEILTAIVVLAGWVGIGTYAVHRWMPNEPRR